MTEGSDWIAVMTKVTTAWLSNPNSHLDAKDLPELLRSVHDVLVDLARPSAGDAASLPGVTAEPEPDPEPVVYVPVVSVAESLARPDAILSLITGKPYKALRRHLTAHGLTPETYRERYNLDPDYPMVAADYLMSAREAAFSRPGRRHPGEVAKVTLPSASAAAGLRQRSRRQLRAAAIAAQQQESESKKMASSELALATASD